MTLTATASPAGARGIAVLRGLGALAVLGVGAVHLYEYLHDHYSDIPTISTLFLLNAASAAAVAAGLVTPLHRLLPRRLADLALRALAAGGALIAVGALVALFVSESTPLFGFMETGYRTVIVLAIAVEGATVLLLGALLALSLSRPAR